ncbi:14.7 kDa heat shock protein-like isoform X2 [Raphanus sativus]|uniref:14.7 kDa heat shock protein-like isoform X2 n=1 Tax=Raphanus sativus TaxID=3726 RepID=A0A9W3DL73_RAPSA|nr:14.7 kDa heat shock protein-like isoform X2 [Raphanus sativus]
MSKSGSSSGNKNQGSSGSGVPNNSPPPISRNRFLKSGNQAVYEVIETKDSVIYRVDLPGCPASDLTYWVDGNNVHFFADEPVMSEYDHDGRRYGGTMVFNPVANKVNEAKAKLRDGVLWITVPKVPGINVKRVIENRMVNCKITRHDVV